MNTSGEIERVIILGLQYFRRVFRRTNTRGKLGLDGTIEE
jgi:hypothetical protein